MPILSENKERYPANWDEISHHIRFVKAKGKCEVCGVPHSAAIKRLPGGVYRTPSPQEWDMINSRVKHSHSSMSFMDL